MSDVEKLFKAIETMRVALESANEWIGDQILLNDLSPSQPIVGEIGFALGCASETVKIARASTLTRSHDARLIEALEDVLATGLNGGNNVRLAFIAAGGKELSDELLAKADASEKAVERARAVLTQVREGGE